MPFGIFPPASGSELGDTKSLLVGSEQVTQMFCQFARWGSMLKAYLYALYSIFLANS